MDNICLRTIDGPPKKKFDRDQIESTSEEVYIDEEIKMK